MLFEAVAPEPSDGGLHKEAVLHPPRTGFQGFRRCEPVLGSE